MAFNSEEYGYADIQIVLLGRNVVGLRGLRYKSMQEKSNVHGAGAKPITRARGQINYEGSIKILFSELRALLISQGQKTDGPIKIRPFDIAVVYAPSITSVIATERLVFCEFTECEINWNNGDQFAEIELPIVIGEIQYNV
ncbi:MAG: hypothetical protein ACRC1W_13285 [Shewanella sp.]